MWAEIMLAVSLACGTDFCMYALSRLWRRGVL
jgi:hypothetical protein